MSDGDRVVGIVLAAGASTRMGAPKALVDLAGRTFVEHAVASLADGGCSPLVVVVGAMAPERLRELDLRGAAVVDNPRWREGPTVSLQVGLTAARARASTATAAVVHTVDRPRVRASTVAALLRAHASFPTAVCQPQREGRGGHPLLWPASCFATLTALRPEQTRRDLLRGPAAIERHRVAVDDPGIHDNVDDPSALDGLL